MNQDRARRHARWRLPSGVYNPIVTVDGRRWRDYEQAAEAPAPSLDDRRIEVRVPVLQNGADMLAAAVLNGLGGAIVATSAGVAVPAATIGFGGEADRIWAAGEVAVAEVAEKAEGAGDAAASGGDADDGADDRDRERDSGDPGDSPEDAAGSADEEAPFGDPRIDEDGADARQTGESGNHEAAARPGDAASAGDDGRAEEEPAATVADEPGGGQDAGHTADAGAGADAGDADRAEEIWAALAACSTGGPADAGHAEEERTGQGTGRDAVGAWHGDDARTAADAPPGAKHAWAAELTGEAASAGGADDHEDHEDVDDFDDLEEWKDQEGRVDRDSREDREDREDWKDRVDREGREDWEDGENWEDGEGQEDREDRGFFDAVLIAGDPADRTDRWVSAGPVAFGGSPVPAPGERRWPQIGVARNGVPKNGVERNGVPQIGVSRNGLENDGRPRDRRPYTETEQLWTAAFHDDVERDWLDRPCRPPRLEYTRPYGRPGGLAEPDPDAQDNLLHAVNGRFPDPRGTWIRLINAEGPSEDPFRSNNAVDCALAVMSTWHGEPVVACRRQPEHDPSGRPLLTGETAGVTRAEEWLGHRFEYVGHGRRAYVAIAQRLIFGGHGAAAVLITRWPGGGSHAWNAVNCRGEVLWIDAQRGHMALEPPYDDVTGVFSVVIDRQGQRL